MSYTGDMSKHIDSQELIVEIRVRLTPQLKKALKLKAVEENSDISATVRRLVEEYVSAE